MNSCTVCLRIIVPFCPNSMQTIPCACRRGTYPGKRPECSLTPIGWPHFLYNPAQCWRGRGRKILEILGKKPTLNTLYIVDIFFGKILLYFLAMFVRESLYIYVHTHTYSWNADKTLNEIKKIELEIFSIYLNGVISQPCWKSGNAAQVSRRGFRNFSEFVLRPELPSLSQILANCQFMTCHFLTKPCPINCRFCHMLTNCDLMISFCADSQI